MTGDKDTVAGNDRMFSKMPEFDRAMRKITSVSKAEIERRENAERDE